MKSKRQDNVNLVKGKNVFRVPNHRKDSKRLQELERGVKSNEHKK